MKKVVNFTYGSIIVFAILYFCAFVLQLCKITFPAPILGIVVLFVLLKTKIIKEESVKDFCEFMLKYMILFFIPALVGIVAYKEIIYKNLYPILITVFITTTLIIVFVGLFVYNVIKYQRFFNIKKGTKK